MSFSCTSPCTDTFCTSSALPLKNPQSVANLKKAICVVRSDSIMGVTLYITKQQPTTQRLFFVFFFFSQEFFILKRQTRDGGKYGIWKICSRATQNLGTCKYFKKNQTFFYIDLGYVKLTSFWKQEYRIISRSEQYYGMKLSTCRIN